MKIAIIAAMQEEMNILQNHLQNIKILSIANYNILEGTINNCPVVLLKSGIGKVSAALGTALVLSHTKPDYVINTGSAGAIQKNLNIGDIVISTQVKHHDVDVTAFGYEKGQLPIQPVTFNTDNKLISVASKAVDNCKLNSILGLICSGDQFLSEKEQVENLQKNFADVIAVDMEAAAIAQVCYAFKMPFISVRCISDLSDSAESFKEFLYLASRNSSSIVLDMIKQLDENN